MLPSICLTSIQWLNISEPEFNYLDRVTRDLFAFWLARRFGLVQSVQTHSLWLGIWGQTAVFISTVLRSHFSTLTISFFVLNFCKAAAEVIILTHLIWYLSGLHAIHVIFFEFLHISGHDQFKYVAVDSVSKFLKHNQNNFSKQASTCLYLLPLKLTWFSLEALNAFFVAQDEEFKEFRST